MSVWMMCFLALGLAMDAFAVSVANGICYPRRPLKMALLCGVCFGVFQMLMPLLGYLAGFSFLGLISGIDHWIALLLLGIIGGRMIWEAAKDMRSPQKLRRGCPLFTLRVLLLQAFATSIDALAVGVGLGVVDVNLPLMIGLIGLAAFVCSFLGVMVGRLVGQRFSEHAQLFGGIVLVLIGLHIFGEHFFG